VSRRSAEPVNVPTKAARIRQKKGVSQRWPTVVLWLCFLSLIFCAAAVSYHIHHSSLQNSFDGSMAKSSAADRHVGKIMIKRGDQVCERLKFDNDTGQMIGSPGSCVTEADGDAQNVPLPIGTMHRLDAISKSFSGK
jgi:hypothetical protein